jgi:hypothetical protein
MLSRRRPTISSLNSQAQEGVTLPSNKDIAEAALDECGCRAADILMLTGSREGSKVLYRNIVSEVFYSHRSFAIVAGINAEKNR